MLFIDEIHRLQPAVEEMLYPALEDYELDIIIGQGPQRARHHRGAGRSRFIGATTRARTADRRRCARASASCCASSSTPTTT